MDKCPVCKEEKTIIHTAAGDKMCPQCYWKMIKEDYPNIYKQLRSARRA